MKVQFRNLKPSQLIKDTLKNRLQDDLERFPALHDKDVTVVVAMENSPHQAGPDLFQIKLRITAGKYKGIILEKEADNFYSALSQLNDSIKERLGRFNDKKTQVRRRNDHKKQALA